MQKMLTKQITGFQRIQKLSASFIASKKYNLKSILKSVDPHVRMCVFYFLWEILSYKKDRNKIIFINEYI